MAWPVWLLVLAAALAPAIPLEFVSGRLMAHARSTWLLGLLTVGIVWLAPRELWLSLIGLWFLLRWPTHPDPPSLLPSLVQWIGVGMTWSLLLTIPKAWLAWAAWGWLAVAAWESAQVVKRRIQRGGRQKGRMGSPVLTALYLALVSPFCPWWGWPLLGVGLGLICSWSALAGVGLGMIWLWPRLWLLGAILMLLVAVLWAYAPRVPGERGRTIFGRRPLEWTPRGDTLDSVVSRWHGWRLMVRESRKRWLLGHGPASTEAALLRWGSRYDLELCWGEGFNDALQVYYEYGALGLLAVLAFACRVVPHLRFEDPWSAAWLVGVVLSLTHWPLRHVSIGLVWLTISARLAG